MSCIGMIDTKVVFLQVENEIGHVSQSGQWAVSLAKYPPFDD